MDSLCSGLSTGRGLVLCPNGGGISVELLAKMAPPGFSSVK
jgi:hypothetical protein